MCVRTQEMALPEKPASIEADLQEEKMSRLRQTYSREILCPPSTITFEEKQTPQFKMSWRVLVVQNASGLDCVCQEADRKLREECQEARRKRIYLCTCRQHVSQMYLITRRCMAMMFSTNFNALGEAERVPTNICYILAYKSGAISLSYGLTTLGSLRGASFTDILDHENM